MQASYDELVQESKKDKEEIKAQLYQANLELIKTNSKL